MTHICLSKLTFNGSDNGLSPGRRQAIIWTNAGILFIWPPETNFSEILFEIHTFSFKKMQLKMSSEKWRPFCFGLNVFSSGIQLRIKRCWLLRNPGNGWNWRHFNHVKASTRLEITANYLWIKMTELLLSIDPSVNYTRLNCHLLLQRDLAYCWKICHTTRT